MDKHTHSISGVLQLKQIVLINPAHTPPETEDIVNISLITKLGLRVLGAKGHHSACQETRSPLKGQSASFLSISLDYTSENSNKLPAKNSLP